MFPILFKIPEWFPLLGGRALHVYGLMTAIGFMSGLFWVRYEAKRVDLNPEKLMDLFFAIVLASVVGARLLFVFVSVNNWWEDPLVFFRIWEGGLVFYGGLIGAVLTSVWTIHRHRLPFFRVADVFAPGIALGHAFGRLGCLAAGCCYGRPAPLGSWLSVIFPETEYSIAPSGIPLYSTQLMESFGLFCIFLFLFFFRKRKKFNGEVFLLYLILYPFLRIVMETFRGDKIRGVFWGGSVSTSQLISLIWIVVALIVWCSLLRRKKV